MGGSGAVCPTAFGWLDNGRAELREKAAMFRALTAATPRDFAKWGAYAVLLLAPGSFFVLPILWLVRQGRMK